jgi:hypothetical protein
MATNLSQDRVTGRAGVEIGTDLVTQTVDDDRRTRSSALAVSPDEERTPIAAVPRAAAQAVD